MGFDFGDSTTVLARYSPQTLRYGYNRIDGEDVFFIPNPGLGLWAYRGKLLAFEDADDYHSEQTGKKWAPESR